MKNTLFKLNFWFYLIWDINLLSGEKKNINKILIFILHDWLFEVRVEFEIKFPLLVKGELDPSSMDWIGGGEREADELLYALMLCSPDKNICISWSCFVWIQ